MKQCNHCGNWKDEEEFSFRYKFLGVRANTCKECKSMQDASSYGKHHADRRQSVKKRLTGKKQAARDYVFDYLSYHVCEVCGEYRPEMLQFDHVRGKKKKNISDMVMAGESSVGGEELRALAFIAASMQVNGFDPIEATARAR